MQEKNLAWLLVRHQKLLDAYLEITNETQNLIDIIRNLRELLNHVHLDLRDYIQQLSSKTREDIGTVQQYYKLDRELAHHLHYLYRLMKQWEYLRKSLKRHYEQLKRLEPAGTADERSEETQQAEKATSTSRSGMPYLKEAVGPKTLLLIHEYGVLKKELMNLNTQLKQMQKHTLEKLPVKAFTHQHLIKITLGKTVDTEKSCYLSGIRLEKCRLELESAMKKGKQLYESLQAEHKLDEKVRPLADKPMIPKPYLVKET